MMVDAQTSRAICDRAWREYVHRRKRAAQPMTTLPAVAEHKLRALEAAALDAQALAQASKVAIDRLNVDVGNLTTRQTFHAGNSDKAQASAVAADLAKVTAALDAAQAEHFEPQARAQACARTLTQVRARPRGLRPDAVLEPVEPEPVKMPPGEGGAAALTRVRSTVLDLAHERENVARAAPTQGELREAVACDVAELAEQALALARRDRRAPRQLEHARPAAPVLRVAGARRAGRHAAARARRRRRRRHDRRAAAPPASPRSRARSTKPSGKRKRSWSCASPPASPSTAGPTRARPPCSACAPCAPSRRRRRRWPNEHETPV